MNIVSINLKVSYISKLERVSLGSKAKRSPNEDAQMLNCVFLISASALYSEGE